MKKEDLEKIIKNQEIISIYTSEENDSFDVGVCIASDEEHLVYNAINKFGEDNGLVCIPLESIFKISYDGKYEKMIEKIWKPVSYENFILDNQDTLASFLNNIQKKNKIVYIENYGDEDSAITGCIESFDDDTITLKSYDCYGEYEGMSVLTLDSITIFIYNSKITRKIEKLSER